MLPDRNTIDVVITLATAVGAGLLAFAAVRLDQQQTMLAEIHRQQTETHQRLLVIEKKLLAPTSKKGTKK